jgi:hypothetical protein
MENYFSKIFNKINCTKCNCFNKNSYTCNNITYDYNERNNPIPIDDPNEFFCVYFTDINLLDLYIKL